MRALQQIMRGRQIAGEPMPGATPLGIGLARVLAPFGERMMLQGTQELERIKQSEQGYRIDELVKALGGGQEVQELGAISKAQGSVEPLLNYWQEKHKTVKKSLKAGRPGSPLYDPETGEIYGALPGEYKPETQVTVQNAAEKKFMSTLSDEAAKEVSEMRKALASDVEVEYTLDTLKDLREKAFKGPIYNKGLGMMRVLNAIGVPISEEALSSSEAFQRVVNSAVLDWAKKLAPVTKTDIDFLIDSFVNLGLTGQGYEKLDSFIRGKMDIRRQIYEERTGRLIETYPEAETLLAPPRYSKSGRVKENMPKRGAGPKWRSKTGIIYNQERLERSAEYYGIPIETMIEHGGLTRMP